MYIYIYIYIYMLYGDLYMVVGNKAIRYGLDGPGFKILLGPRFSASIQVGKEVHPASCKMVTEFFHLSKATRVWR